MLSELGEPYGTQLGRMFVEGVKGAVSAMVDWSEAWPERFSMDAWANVNERGDGNSAHIHPGCAWSGVYYVATEQDAGGHIAFIDPRTAALMVNHPLNPFSGNDALNVPPVAGLILVFPSFLYHRVDAYRGESPRISIAFNLK